MTFMNSGSFALFFYISQFTSHHVAMSDLNLETFPRLACGTPDIIITHSRHKKRN